MGTNCKRATRPCSCGFLGHSTGRCRCTPGQVARYRSRISGPLIDRIDLQIEVPALSREEFAQKGQGETSASIRERVERARSFQLARQGKSNARLAAREIARHCTPDGPGAELLKQAIARLGLSARAYDRVLKVARTIADLAGAVRIDAAHIAEAIQYRRFDRGTPA